MTHRIKNLFAMTDGMIRFTEKSATTPKEMSALLSGRMNALADANALVRREFSEGSVSAPTSDLRKLIEKIAQPHEYSTPEGVRRSPSTDHSCGVASVRPTASPSFSTS